MLARLVLSPLSSLPSPPLVFLLGIRRLLVRPPYGMLQVPSGLGALSGERNVENS